MLSVKLFFRPTLTSLLTKMSLAKSLPARSFTRLRVVRSPQQTFQWRQWQRASRRGYASAGEKAKETAGKASAAMKSDLPWLIGSIAVTVPSTYFILASGSAGRNGPGKHDEGHDGEEHEEQEEGDEEQSEEQEGEEGSGDEKAAGGEEKAEGDGDKDEGEENGKAKDGDEEQDGRDEEAKDGQHSDARVMAGKKPEAGDVKPRGGDKKQEGGNENAKEDQQIPEEGEDKSDGDKEQSSDGKGRQTSSKEGKAAGKQVQEQPKDNSLSKKTASGKPGKFDEEVELENDSNSKTIHKPDAKGGAKRRIESGNAIKLGEADDDDDDDDDGGDKAAASKTPVKGQMSGKQAGLSNTDTKHSTDPANDPEKSKKSEGAPETAKLQGTVDPGRKLG